ncbi:MAG TPA: phenylalanine--tRNA ligase subunit alpha [Patescibacteria group bacterium]
MNMEETLIKIKNEALSLILETSEQAQLEEIKLQFLGRNGKLTLAFKDLTKLPIEKRPEVGKLANEIKIILEEAIDDRKKLLKEHASQKERANLDVTNPGIKPLLGHLHLITQAISEITSIFEKIGITRVRYPEIEWDYYAFTALNFPENHPARDDWETFFTTEETNSKFGQIILTPHTSSGQVREMEKAVKLSQKTGDPISIRMLNIAKCYRRQSDVSHTQMFHQFEGLVVGENISIVHLKGVLDYFVKSYFGEKRQSRIRPYHFQFTEPSFEVDVTCGVCLGKGCKLCKAGWLEMGGAGMVHPNVLKYGGIDPKKYTGFAFGWGVERVLMMKEGIEIDDLRLLYSNKLEFLEQF